MCKKRNWICMLGLFVVAISPFVLAGNYPDEVKTDKPVAYWQFENSLTDSIANLTLLPSEAPVFVSGTGTNNKAYSSKSAKAWAFALKTLKLFDIPSFSYEMWINPAGVNKEVYVLMRRSSPEVGTGGENSLVYNYTDGRLEFRSDHQEFDPAPGIDLPDNTNKWHHIAVVYDDSIGAIVMYLDGKEVERSEGYVTMLESGHDEEIYIGGTRNAIGKNLFNGYLDEVALYDFPLSSAQVAAHYAAAFPTDYPAKVKADKPVVYWRFENSFADEMKTYDLIPSGMNYVPGPKSTSNVALTGRVTNSEADVLYGFESFTYELWFNNINKSVKSYILFRAAGSAQQAILYGYNTDTLEYFSEYNPRPGVVVPNGVDKWHHTVMVYDNDLQELRVYLDGALVDTKSGAANTGSAGTMICLNGSDMGDNFNGYIDEVAIYDHVLSEDRIKVHYNAPFATAVSDWTLF